MIKKLLIIVSIFSLSYTMEKEKIERDEVEQDSDERPSLTDNEFIWYNVARYLDPKDRFLNEHLARLIRLDEETREKIIQAFLESLELKADKDSKLKAIASFYNFSHLEEKDNLLGARFKKEKKLIAHSFNCKGIISCKKCNGIQARISGSLEPKIANILTKWAKDSFYLKQHRVQTLCMCYYPVFFVIFMIFFAYTLTD